MQTYFILGNWTQKGMANLKESPQRIEAAKKATEALGGRWLGWYLVMGRYDFIVIVELPDADAAATILLGTGMQGNVETETLRAWTEWEFQDLLARLS